jgi:large subunit ribosomal protein L21e
MPHSYGKRARTRNLFAQGFRKHGPVALSKYMVNYKVGEYVDVKGNGSIHKGMPYKFYHGRTGKIWNITPRAVGVIVNKRVRGRIIPKKIHVRVEHVKKSNCQKDITATNKLRVEYAKWNKENPNGPKKYVAKRTPALPRGQFTLRMKGHKLETVEPIPYEINA